MMNTVDKRKILKIGLFIAAAIPVVIVSIVCIRACCLLQSKKELQNIRNATASVVLSQEGKLIGKIFIENRTNITYELIPEYLIHALVATEDARFYNHNGVDSRSLFRVFFKTILLNRQSAGGGSTITQQLAKNLFGRKTKGPFRLLTIKTKEALLARRLEKIFTKEEILTLYFNTVPFGENIYGIEAAAQRYFNKKTDQLRMEESAVLIGMLKANHVYNPRLHPENAKSRRNVVFKQMQKYEYLDAATVDSLSKLPLQLNYANLEQNGPADYFLYQVKKEVREILQNVESASDQKWNLEEDGLIIKTTLNLDIQNFTNQSFRDHLSTMQFLLEKQYKSKAGRKFIENLVETELKKQDLTESASVTDSIRQSLQLLHAGLLAMDPVTGAVRAWVGGIDFKTHPYDQILARRQMGSTLKPVLFAAALEMGYSPCHYLDNDSLVITGYEDWKPRNFDHSYGGKYSLTGALVHSMNIPAVNLFLEIGFGSLDSLWRRLGFFFALDNTPSLALGTAEASIQEVAVAYSVFANGGFRISPQKIVSIQSHDGQVIWQNEFMEEKVSVLSERTSHLMNAMLRNAVRAGTGTPLRSRYGVEFPMAGKTGTTQDYTDAWFAAYCPSLVVVSRVGASLPAVHFNTSYYGTGSALALPLVALTLKKIQDNPKLSKRFITPFPLPDPELERQMDCPDFKETDLLDNILDFLKRKKIDYDKSGKRPERKRRPWFRRWR
ncbi:MAG: transglycosylase domain-containing protein [Bacteroidales bacterium]|nr:transglycosylase domain-containing protein [Bacteroidales bacterium]